MGEEKNIDVISASDGHACSQEEMQELHDLQLTNMKSHGIPQVPNARTAARCAGGEGIVHTSYMDPHEICFVYDEGGLTHNLIGGLCEAPPAIKCEFQKCANPEQEQYSSPALDLNAPTLDFLKMT